MLGLGTLHSGYYFKKEPVCLPSGVSIGKGVFCSLANDVSEENLSVTALLGQDVLSGRDQFLNFQLSKVFFI